MGSVGSTTGTSRSGTATGSRDAGREDRAQTRLDDLATATGGAVVDVGTDVRFDSRINALDLQADAHKDCVYGENLVASGIRDVVRAYQNSNLKYVTLVGGNSSVPFFRYPIRLTSRRSRGSCRRSALGPPSEASLLSKYVLGQDEYGASTILNLGGTRFPVPDKAVGRLVESASEAKTMLDAYLIGTGASTTLKSVTPTSSLVTGYDFLTDSSTAVKNQLQLGTGQTPDSLINDTWTADQLRPKLLGAPKKDLVYLAGHFDSGQAFAADKVSSVNVNELMPASVDLTDSIVFSTGCHAGYNWSTATASPG